MSQLETAIQQICKVRGYTNDMLNHIDPTDWFRQPSEGVTHVAWQVGHLAVAEYRLALQHIRGQRSEDEELISAEFLTTFGKGSVPEPNAEKYPTPDEIRGVFDRVHQQTVAELKQLPESVVDEALEPAHPMFNTKLGALQWAAQHEMLHAGQIGLLRRLLGLESLR